MMISQLWLFDNLDMTEDDFLTSVQMALNSLGVPGFNPNLNKTDVENPGSSDDSFDKPTAITYFGDTVRSTAYDGAVTINFYKKIKLALFSKLGSAFEETDFASYAAAIENGEGVIYDYGREISLKLLLSMSEVTGENIKFRYIVQTPDRIFLKSDKVYSAQVTTDFAEMKSVFESDAALMPVAIYGRAKSMVQYSNLNDVRQSQKLEPASIFPSEKGRALPVLYNSNSIYNDQNGFSNKGLSSVLNAFMYSGGAVKRYTEKNGTAVYVKNYSNIKIGTSGQLSFKASKVEDGIPVGSLINKSESEYYTLTDVIYAANTLFRNIGTDVLGGSAELRFYQAYFDGETGSLVVEYDFVVNGLKVEIDTPAASIRYKDGYITEARAALRNFSFSGTYFFPLDIVKVAELIMLENKTATDIAICYSPKAAGEFTPPAYVQKVRAEDGI